MPAMKGSCHTLHNRHAAWVTVLVSDLATMLNFQSVPWVYQPVVWKLVPKRTGVQK